MTAQHKNTAEHDSSSDVGELNELTARRALEAACVQLDLPARAAQLIRIGSNAVFRLVGSQFVIARVARSVERLGEARKQVLISRWLRDRQYPATRALAVTQPVVAEGRVVTFWESVSDQEEYAPIGDVARLIRQLHDLPAPSDEITLPSLEPFGPRDVPLPRFPGIDSKDAKYLAERLAWARSAFPTLPFALPPGHIHGDANVGNVIKDSQGAPVLIDLDSFSVGPREWDLIQTAIFADRLGWHTRAEYETFIEIYGYDITQWEAYPILAEMRELAMTSWLAQKAARSSRSAREAAKRIDAIRTGGSRTDWAPY